MFDLLVYWLGSITPIQIAIATTFLITLLGFPLYYAYVDKETKTIANSIIPSAINMFNQRLNIELGITVESALEYGNDKNSVKSELQYHLLKIYFKPYTVIMKHFLAIVLPVFIIRIKNFIPIRFILISIFEFVIDLICFMCGIQFYSTILTFDIQMIKEILITHFEICVEYVIPLYLIKKLITTHVKSIYIPLK